MRSWLYPAGALLGVLVIWQFVVMVLNTPTYLLPSPLVILETVRDTVPEMSRQAGVTVTEVLVGYASAIALAIPIGVLIIWFSRFEAAVYPLLVATQTIPKVAVAPLFVVWFGFSLLPKVLIVVMIAFFPIVISFVVGLKSVDTESIQLLRSMGASRLQTLMKLQFPSSLPSLFGGLKVAVSFAVVGAVVGEFVGSNSGLGYVLLQATGTIQTERVFAGIIWLMGIGIFLFYAVSFIENRLTGWQADDSLSGQRPVNTTL